MTRNATKTDASTAFATIRTAAKRWGVPEAALRRATQSGDLAVYRPAGSWPLIALEDVRRWLAAQRVEPTAHARARVAEVLRREAERERRAG